MTREAIIERTLNAIKGLPAEKAIEISDFAEFISKRYEEQVLSDGIKQMTSSSAAFDFLGNEEDLYDASDLKEFYNA